MEQKPTANPPLEDDSVIAPSKDDMNPKDYILNVIIPNLSPEQKEYRLKRSYDQLINNEFPHEED